MWMSSRRALRSSRRAWRSSRTAWWRPPFEAVASTTRRRTSRRRVEFEGVVRGPCRTLPDPYMAVSGRNPAGHCRTGSGPAVVRQWSDNCRARRSLAAGGNRHKTLERASPAAPKRRIATAKTTPKIVSAPPLSSRPNTPKGPLWRTCNENRAENAFLGQNYSSRTRACLPSAAPRGTAGQTSAPPTTTPTTRE